MKPDPLAALVKLAVPARNEAPVGVDVADQVLATLRSRQPRLASVEPEYALAGIGSLFAACAALLLVGIGAGDDAFITLAQPFFAVLP